MLIDSRSQVTTLTYEYFEENFKEQVLRNHTPIRLTVANGLNLPYVGYFESDIVINYIVIKNVAIFVLKAGAVAIALVRKKDKVLRLC